jgi:malate dehydrogenase
MHRIMTTVCILGAGELGGAVAHALAQRGRVRRVILIDASRTIAAGKALDIQQAGAIEGFHAQLSGTDDETRVMGCAVCVLADRSGPSAAEWRGEDALALLRRLGPYLGQAPLVCAGTGQVPLLAAAAREAGWRRERLIGSAPEALASAAAAVVAMEARCSPSEVKLTVLGTPPDGFVVPWSEASIGGHALDRVLTQVQLSRLEGRLPRLWPPGPYALGLAAAQVAEGLVMSSRRTFRVFSVLSGEFGVHGRVGVLPALLSPAGIARVRIPTLNTRERVQLETALGR